MEADHLTSRWAWWHRCLLSRELFGQPVSLVPVAMLLFLSAGMKFEVLVACHIQSPQLFASKCAELAWLPMAELLIGFGLSLSRWRRIAVPIALALFAAFADVSLSAVVLGKDSCGCLGSIAVNPSLMAVADFVAVGLLVWSVRSTGATVGRHWQLNDWCQVGLLVLLGLSLGSTSWAREWSQAFATVAEAGKEHRRVFEPRDWSNRECPLLENITGGERLRRGQWLILFVRPGCAECERVVAQHQSASQAEHRRGAVKSESIAIVSVFSDWRGTPIPQQALVTKLSTDSPWYVQAPLVLQLTGGIVQ